VLTVVNALMVAFAAELIVREMLYSHLVLDKSIPDMNFSFTCRKKSCLFLLFFLSIFIQGCIYRIEKVSLEGHLIGNPKAYIYISEFNGDSLALIDSVKTSSKGYFKVELEAESPSFITIGLNKAQTSITLLIQPGEEIRIQTMDPTLIDYKVFGSNGSELLRRLMIRLNGAKSQIDSLKNMYNSNLSSPKIDSIQHLLDSTYQTITTNHQNYTYNFINQNTFSPVSILALFQAYDSIHPVLDYARDRKLFRIIDSSLLSVYSSNSMVKVYHAKIQKLDSLYERSFKRELMFKVGEVLPNVGYPITTGDNLFISGIWFKYILIDFWGSWCEVCPKNNIQLRDIYKEYAPKGLVVLQVSLGINPDSLQKMVVRDSLPWYNGFVADMYNSKLLDTLKISSVPSNYITDRWGNIKAVNLTGDRLRLKLKELLP